MSLNLGKILDPAGLITGKDSGGGDGKPSLLDPLGILPKGFNPLDPLGILGGDEGAKSADGSSASGASGSEGASGGFNIFDPLGILAKLGIPTPDQVLKAATGNAAQLVGGLPTGGQGGGEG